jgi:hypothetical protein
MADFEMVGTARFELATPCTPSKCATRLRHVPTGEESANLMLCKNTSALSGGVQCYFTPAAKDLFQITPVRADAYFHQQRDFEVMDFLHVFPNQ